MNSHANRASGGEPSPSLRRTLSLSNGTHGSRTDEAYDLSEFTVADGFRPTEPSLHSDSAGSSSLQSPSVSQTRSHSPSPSNVSCSARPEGIRQSSLARANLAAINSASAMRSRPSSISKAHRPHESLALRNDGSTHTAAALHSGRPEILPTGIPLAGQSGGSGGFSGPSHPYSSYPQRTMSETASIVGEPIREGSYEGPRGPTHPYSLYPQTTAPLADAGAQSIPVGFGGLENTYRRQIGADGEEAGDLIGPLGHMEELPPYTRYPDPAHMRTAPAEIPTETPSQGSNTGGPVNGTQSSGTSAADARRLTGSLESQSTETFVAPRSARSGETTDSSRTDISMMKDVVQRPRGKWEMRAKKRFLGVIPYWAICLLVFCLIIVGIVMGVVLGILLSDDRKHKPDGDESEANSQPLPTVDVDPYDELPSGLDPLTTGVYSLPPLDLYNSPRACINDTTKTQAWSCEIAHRYYSLEVGAIANTSPVEDFDIQLENINGSDGVYLWGMQPPSIAEPLPLRLVNDTFESGRGPAWWLQIAYDKVVIVSDSSFSAKRKRGSDYDRHYHDEFKYNRFTSSGIGPADGERAWMCVWPNVTMEIFIFPSQNSSSTNTATTTLPTTSTTAAVEAAATTSDSASPYPQLVKFLERRLYQDNDTTAATCSYIEVTNGGRDSNPVLDDDGNPVEVTITERRSTYDELLEQKERSRYPTRSEILPREETELTDCGCLWWST